MKFRLEDEPSEELNSVLLLRISKGLDRYIRSEKLLGVSLKCS